VTLTHHELCFGCGRTNLFGLLLEVERTDDAGVSGRCFLKQDHQGAERGYAHEGIIAAALSEAISLAAGPDARIRTLEVRIEGRAPVGAFLELHAERSGASARADGVLVATATATV
jgi:hypothetical protein